MAERKSNKHKLSSTNLDMGKYRGRSPRKQGYQCDGCRQSFLPPSNETSDWKGAQEKKVCPRPVAA